MTHSFPSDLLTPFIHSFIHYCYLVEQITQSFTVPLIYRFPNKKLNKEPAYRIIYFLSLWLFGSPCDSPYVHVCVFLYRSHTEWQNNITQCPTLNSHKTQPSTALQTCFHSDPWPCTITHRKNHVIYWQQVQFAVFQLIMAGSLPTLEHVKNSRSGKTAFAVLQFCTVERNTSLPPQEYQTILLGT